MKATELPPLSFLNECFTYCPETGKLFWKERPLHHFKFVRGWSRFNIGYAGTVAGNAGFQKDGSPSSIRVRIHAGGKCRAYTVHRLIFSIMGISIPAGFEVDHRDGNPFNNKWSNLRLATVSQNAQNKRKMNGRKYADMPKGVYPLRGQFMASIRLNGKATYLGMFSTAAEAHAVYCSKADELFGEFSRFN